MANPVTRGMKTGPLTSTNAYTPPLKKRSTKGTGPKGKAAGRSQSAKIGQGKGGSKTSLPKGLK